ncbi:hypothetical protein BpHYR1_044774 [Brachionus plicatilis]|uniref:Uncharacterized protein n=1 Tax=Brachionus plicatilis TaxID=10195 RepID=A0A3M7R7I2_BRAPC|nr:hypothetical protein BpHYR1_044774 [Brachionus plicatilis]
MQSFRRASHNIQHHFAERFNQVPFKRILNEDLNNCFSLALVPVESRQYAINKMIHTLHYIFIAKY